MSRPLLILCSHESPSHLTEGRAWQCRLRTPNRAVLVRDTAEVPLILAAAEASGDLSYVEFNRQHFRQYYINLAMHFRIQHVLGFGSFPEFLIGYFTESPYLTEIFLTGRPQSFSADFPQPEKVRWISSEQISTALP